MATPDNFEEQFGAIKGANKFGDDDADYLRRRSVFAEEIGKPDLYEYIDQFGLYAGEQTLATRLVIYDIFKSTLDIPGDVVEFGCWNGANLLFLAKILKLTRPNSIKSVIGFDSFEGLQSFSAEDGEAESSYRGRYQGNEDTLRKAITLFGMESWVHLVKGDACKTIPAFADSFPHSMVSFAYIDFDLYEPSKAALNYLGKRLSPGGVIVLDEALTHTWQGEGVALQEFLEDQAGSKFDAHSTPIARQPTLFLVKR